MANLAESIIRVIASPKYRSFTPTPMQWYQRPVAPESQLRSRYTCNWSRLSEDRKSCRQSPESGWYHMILINCAGNQIKYKNRGWWLLTAQEFWRWIFDSFPKLIIFFGLGRLLRCQLFWCGRNITLLFRAEMCLPVSEILSLGLHYRSDDTEKKKHSYFRSTAQSMLFSANATGHCLPS